jgi:hypothetical protein
VIGAFFSRKPERYYPQFLYQLALDMFAIVHCWEPFPISGPQRGRMFEGVLYAYCRRRSIPLSETAGSRTLRRQSSASGLHHESDAVIAMPDLTVHLELKHLSQEVTKGDLVIFNQKGLDFLAGPNANLRRPPLYRILLSGSLLTPEARTFALQWGILVIEPERMPLLLLHWLSGRFISDLPESTRSCSDEIWSEVPAFIAPLQQRVRRLATLLDGGEALLSPFRIERMTGVFQRRCGDEYWCMLDTVAPNWLEDVFEGLGLSDASGSGRSLLLGRHSAQMKVEKAEEGVA